MITRDNYEELFLLYVDNELSAAEKTTVEQFVRDNPDLETELLQLQQSVLCPEDGLFFSNKESLLREPTTIEPASEEPLLRGELPVWAGESSFIEEGNYPVYLLSYIDNELDKESRKIVDNHLLQHPRLKEELAILRQTRLEPDLSVVFHGKDLLYKQEYSNRSAILSWSRIAAAILLLIAGLLLFDKAKKTNRKQEAGDARIAGSNDSRKDLKKKDSQAVTPHAADPLYKKEDIGVRVQRNKEMLPGTVYPADKRKETPGHGSPEIRTRQQAEDDLVAVTRPPNRDSDSSLQFTPITKPPSTSREAAETAREVPREKTHETTVTSSAPNDSVGTNKNNAIVKDNTVALASEGIPIEDPSVNKKNKLRGLFRKVTRVLGKATNTDNDDNDNNKHGVLIGSFQVAL